MSGIIILVPPPKALLSNPAAIIFLMNIFLPAQTSWGLKMTKKQHNNMIIELIFWNFIFYKYSTTNLQIRLLIFVINQKLSHFLWPSELVGITVQTDPTNGAWSHLYTQQFVLKKSRKTFPSIFFLGKTKFIELFLFLSLRPQELVDHHNKNAQNMAQFWQDCFWNHQLPTPRSTHTHINGIQFLNCQWVHLQSIWGIDIPLNRIQ